MANGLALAGALTALGAFAAYISTIPRGKVPVRPVGTIVLELVAVVLVAAGLALSLGSDGAPPVGVTVPSVVALSIAGLFFFLLSQRKTPIGAIRVRVGDPLLAFAASTSDGGTFHTSELAGKRTLIKFFRGFW